MKKKTILISLSMAAAVAAGYFIYDGVQHARHDLVTLNVSDAPLASVLARISRQTGEQIVAAQRLQGTVTLKVRKAPLRQVLGQIADQVGGFARLNLAVGRSENSFAALRTMIREGQDPTQSGWTNLSALPEPSEMPDGATRVIRRGRAEGGASDGEVNAGPAGGPGEGRAIRRVEIRADSDGSGSTRKMMISNGPDGVVHTLDLSPERLLAERGLTAPLALAGPVPASRESAAGLARRAGGRVDAFYALEAVPLPPGGMPPDLNRFSWQARGEGPDGRHHLSADSMEANLKRHRFDQLTRLTPEQRARSAGGQGAPGPHHEINVEDK